MLEYFCVCGNQKFKTSVSGSGMARDLEVAFEKTTTTTTITLHHDTPVKLQFSLDDFLKVKYISIL